MKRGERYSKEFKEKVLADAREILSSAEDAPRGWISRLAREHGISVPTLIDWVRQDRAPVEHADTPPPKPKAALAVRPVSTGPLPAITNNEEAESIELTESASDRGKIQVVFVSVEGNAATLQKALKQVAALQR